MKIKVQKLTIGAVLIAAASAFLFCSGFKKASDYGNGENGYLLDLPEEDKDKIEALRKGIVDLFKQDLEKCHSVSYEVAKDFLTCNVQEKWREAVC